MSGALRSPLLIAGAAAALVASGPGCRCSRPRLERGDAAAVVVRHQDPTLPAALPAVDESEPNDGAAAPMPLALGEAGGLVLRGSLATPADKDLFALALPGSPPADGAAAQESVSRLAVEIVPAAELPTVLELRDAAGAVVGASTGRPGQRHGLPNLAAPPGARYTIQVARAGKAAAGAGASPEAASYSLVVRLLSFEGGEEREPNDQAGQATPVGPSHTSPEAAGFVGGPRDQDWYRVALGALGEGNVLTVEVEPPPELAVGLSVLDAGERRVAVARGRKGQTVALHNLAAEALRPRTPLPPGEGGAPPEPSFLVTVRGEGGSFDLEHRYVLRVRADPGSDGEREPNEDAQSASPLAGPGDVTGYLGAGDVDVYRLEAPAGASVTIEVEPPKRLDIVLELAAAGPGSASPERWLRADEGRRGQPERLGPWAAPGGPVLIRISPKKGETGAPEPYRLAVRLGAMSAPGTAGDAGRAP
jgi:hypothetical protein